MTNRLDPLRIDLETTFILSNLGRIERVNDPDKSVGPRLCLVGCTAGNLVRMRHDLSDGLVARIATLVADTPPWFLPGSAPACLSDLMTLLSKDDPIAAVETELIWRLPHNAPFDSDAQILCGDTDQGRDLLQHLSQSGVPKHLIEAGFTSVGDFWDPWCVALEGGQIAAIAFAARLGIRGVGIGVYTFPDYRGRGHAAAVTAAWSRLSSLQDRQLFYSAVDTNYASHRVTERLGLEHIGMKLEIR